MSEKDLIGALESIIVRCREGAKGTDWLPTIADIAERALKKAKSAPPAAVPDSVRRDAKWLREKINRCKNGFGLPSFEYGEYLNKVQSLVDGVLAHPAPAVRMEAAIRDVPSQLKQDLERLEKYFQFQGRNGPINHQGPAAEAARRIVAFVRSLF